MADRERFEHLLAEEYRLGGTCVIRGCVPKKLFVHPNGKVPAIVDTEGPDGKETRIFDSSPMTPGDWNGNDNDPAFLMVGVPA
ncbi:pyruvate/2-oxoglutarate dehydrogenase complex dihydrolipoamide dehydrogenase (E3) component [Bradyrhizobium sp. RT9b]|uniref:hypothetical protein n=1 Tax=Bradyrhizobium sp. RT9b TaxID=3156385 RepID=UPI0033988EC1